MAEEETREPITEPTATTTEIECARCKHPFRIHAPRIHRTNAPEVSICTVYPSWSINERKCPNCGAYNAAAIVKVELAWVALDDKTGQQLERSRIVDPRKSLPPEALKRMQSGLMSGLLRKKAR